MHHAACLRHFDGLVILYSSEPWAWQAEDIVDKEEISVLAVVDWDPKRKRVDIAKELRISPLAVNMVVGKKKVAEPNALIFYNKTKEAQGAKHINMAVAQFSRFK